MFRKISRGAHFLDEYIFGDQVNSRHCVGCNSSGELLRVNFSNPNLILFGCRDDKWLTGAPIAVGNQRIMFKQRTLIY
jgi:hypothetical protein